MGVSAAGGGRRTLPLGLRILLVVAFLLALAATGLVVFADDIKLLRLAAVLALWVALIAAFAIARSRRDTRSAQRRQEETRLAYEIELHREIAARTDYEAGLSRQFEAAHADQLEALRVEIDRLASALSRLVDGDVLIERVTLSAESTRVRALSDVGHLTSSRAVSPAPAALDAPTIVDPEPIDDDRQPIDAGSVDAGSVDAGSASAPVDAEPGAEPVGPGPEPESTGVGSAPESFGAGPGPESFGAGSAPVLIGAGSAPVTSGPRAESADEQPVDAGLAAEAAGPDAAGRLSVAVGTVAAPDGPDASAPVAEATQAPVADATPAPAAAAPPVGGAETAAGQGHSVPVPAPSDDDHPTRPLPAIERATAPAADWTWAHRASSPTRRPVPDEPGPVSPVAVAAPPEAAHAARRMPDSDQPPAPHDVPVAAGVTAAHGLQPGHDVPDAPHGDDGADDHHSVTIDDLLSAYGLDGGSRRRRRHD